MILKMFLSPETWLCAGWGGQVCGTLEVKGL